jgi:hypothetical protein
MRDCGKKHRGRGLCAAHLAKARREGTLAARQPTFEAVARHSLTSIDKENGTADCAVCGPNASIRVRNDKRRPVECKGARAIRRRRNWRSVAYGLTFDEFSEMLKQQDGRCAICGDQPEKLDVDHDHDTGKVRALLCPPCNRGLGQFRDRIGVVLAAVAYLELHSSVS